MGQREARTAIRPNNTISGSEGAAIREIENIFFTQGVTAAGDALNNTTGVGDALFFEGNDGSVSMWGKTYNDEYYPVSPLSSGAARAKMDSDQMASTLVNTTSGKWSLSKYSGEVQWTERKRNKFDTGNRSAVILKKLPTNVTATKRNANVPGYEIYDIQGVVDMFKRVAIKG